MAKVLEVDLDSAIYTIEQLPTLPTVCLRGLYYTNHFALMPSNNLVGQYNAPCFGPHEIPNVKFFLNLHFVETIYFSGCDKSWQEANKLCEPAKWILEGLIKD